MKLRKIWALAGNIDQNGYRILKPQGCRLFRELQGTYQFSGLLAKCLTRSELGYYITGAYEY